MRLQAKTAEKLAERFRSNTAFETKSKQGGDHQTQEPTVACFRFPQPRLWMAIAPLHGLLETMHTAFGKPCLLGKTSNTLGGGITKTVDNAKAFVPKSHVG
jgi:hypothetical protein